MSLAEGWRERFGFLESEHGFALTDFIDTPAAFDNCVATYARAPFTLRLSRERGQVFVEMRHGTGPWHDKDALLARHGIHRTRHPLADDGAWTGYATATQAQDLRLYLPTLLHLVQGNSA